MQLASVVTFAVVVVVVVDVVECVSSFIRLTVRPLMGSGPPPQP